MVLSLCWKSHTKRINELGICLEEYVKMNK